jgi:acyl-CoA thioester hydrolase
MPENQWTLVHTSDIPVRWCDMDAFGHVNNSVFFSYFESARIEWWKKIVPKDLSFQDTGPVLINASCTFLKPVFYPETLVIQVLVGPQGRSSYECVYKIYSKNDDTVLYAEGATKVVWVDRKTGRSIPLPDYIGKHLPAK